MSAQGDGLGIGQIHGLAAAAADPALQNGIPQPDGPERRAFPRYAVDCPVSFLLLSGGGIVSGQMLDLSRGGCRLSTPKRIEIGILVRVEICFQLRGISFRIVGVTAGTRTGRSFAVRFLDMPRRAAAELVEVLEEIAAAPPLPEPPKPVPNAMPVVAPVPVAAPAPAIPPAAAQSAAAQEKAAAPPAPVVAPATAIPAVSPNRRSHNRHDVDTRVNLTLVKGAISMPGHILNLSQGGCRLRTDERFNVGIYARVEAEFYLHGLPFRLAGVSQAIMDRNTIGVRFIDMSERKREQLTELIAEIHEAEQVRPLQRSAEKSEDPPDA
jgi:c-di-GMP-binding flagellar brake protein YcgR